MITVHRDAGRKRKQIIATLFSAFALSLVPVSAASADGGTTTDYYQTNYYESYFYSEATCDARGAALIQEVAQIVGWDCYPGWWNGKWSMGVYWNTPGGGGGGGSW